MRNNKMLLVVGLAAALVVAAVIVLISSMLGGKKDKGDAQSGAQSGAGISDSTAGEPAGEEDGEIRELVNLFNESYFISDPEGVRLFLSDDYAGQDNVYAGNGTISDITIEVLTDVSKAKEGDTCQVKVTYLDDEAGTEPQSLTLELVKQADAWKIRSYAQGA